MSAIEYVLFGISSGIPLPNVFVHIQLAYENLLYLVGIQFMVLEVDGYQILLYLIHCHNAFLCKIIDTKWPTQIAIFPDDFPVHEVIDIEVLRERPSIDVIACLVVL